MRPSALLLILMLTTTGCSHVVLFKSSPPGASVFIDGEVQGTTPLFYEEASGFGREYQLRLELEGYQTEAFVLEQEEWLHGCLWPSLCLAPFTLGLSAVGVLFSRTLRDEYHYLLRPLPAVPAPSTAPVSAPGTAPGVVPPLPAAPAPAVSAEPEAVPASPAPADPAPASSAPVNPAPAGQP